MTEFGDKEIRSLFEEMRREDETSAPNFETVANGFHRRPSTGWRLDLPPWAFALATTVVLCALSLALGVWGWRSGSPITPTVTVAQVSELSLWRSPTESLLRSSTDALLNRDLELGFTLDLHSVAPPAAGAGDGGTKEKP